MAELEYGGLYHHYKMDGVISLPYDSKIQVCDWTKELPAFMHDADTLFIDPPWNLGNAKTFYTKAAQVYCGLSFLDFSSMLFQCIDKIAPQTLFIEMGKDFLSWYIEACKLRYHHVTFYNSTYYNKRTNKCYIVHATHDARHKRYAGLEDHDEAKIIQWICKNHSYDCIGDLCMGTGLVGRYAFQARRRFVGIELNPKRLAVLVDFIRRHSIEIIQAPEYA